MGDVAEEDAHMGHGIPARDCLVHVGIPGQLLHIRIAADLHEALASLVGLVPEGLHDPENEEHAAMRLHEALARLGELPRLAGAQEAIDRFRCQPPAEHGVVDAFA